AGSNSAWRLGKSVQVGAGYGCQSNRLEIRDYAVVSAENPNYGCYVGNSNNLLVVTKGAQLAVSSLSGGGLIYVTNSGTVTSLTAKASFLVSDPGSLWAGNSLTPYWRCIVSNGATLNLGTCSFGTYDYSNNALVVTGPSTSLICSTGIVMSFVGIIPAPPNR